MFQAEVKPEKLGKAGFYISRSEDEKKEARQKDEDSTQSDQESTIRSGIHNQIRNTLKKVFS